MDPEEQYAAMQSAKLEAGADPTWLAFANARRAALSAGTRPQRSGQAHC